jgi:hypothetical protein
MRHLLPVLTSPRPIGVARRAALFLAAAACLALLPRAVLAEDAGSFGEVDETCTYTGFRGGPFPGLPPCTEGTKTDPLTCTDCVTSWDPEREERIACEDDSDCVRLVGKYMACGGPMSPFLVDDDDNVYFWAGRWNLHALDNRGNLRWRFDLCKPFDDRLCKTDPDECQPGVTRMVPMVMDYHGTIFFFIGNVLYAISSDGELLLKHRVEIPDVEIEPGAFLNISTGSEDHVGSAWTNLDGSPVLQKNGDIVASYRVTGGSGDVFPSGVISLSRAGEVQETSDFVWRNEPASYMLMTRLLGARDGHLGYAGRLGFGRGQATFFSLRDFEPHWSMEILSDFWVNVDTGLDEIWPDLAAGPNGRVYGVTRHGAVYAFDLQEEVGKRIFNFHHVGGFSWQNRPVIAGDGTMYLGYDVFGGGFLWALDTSHLWENPVAERPDPGSIAEPDDYEGVRWRHSNGGDDTGAVGGWTTPVLSQSGRLYAAMGGIEAFEPESGDVIWKFGMRTMGTAPTILSDGTIVVGQGITGRVFFLEEDTPNGGMAEEGWPTVRHDRYLSNNVEHPFRWDRSGEPPYPSVEELLEDAPPCWNEADWDENECGPLPDPREDFFADAGTPDAGDADASSDAQQSDVDERGDDADAAPDGGQPEDADGSASNDIDEQSDQSSSGGCAGCSTGASMPVPVGHALALVLALTVLASRRLGG